jgi:hypothetical protein
MTTGGPMRGKISEKADAKMMAKIQAPVVKEGLNVLGYMANVGSYYETSRCKTVALTSEPLSGGNSMSLGANNMPKSDRLQ